MKIAGLVLLASFGGLFLAGCGRDGAAATPEQAIQLVLEASRAGDYEEAARYFEGGARIWEQSPSFARDFLDRVTSRGEARSFRVKAERRRGGSVILHVLTCADTGCSRPLRTANWHFQETRRGWIITKVE